MFDLQEKLRTVPPESGTFIVTDGVFSMTGDLLNLPELVAAKKNFPGSRVLLDDAHGLGVLGKGGEGTAAHFGLEKEVDLIMGTFSKSFASIGGFLAGSEEVIHYVRHQAKAFIFSAALPPASAATVLACLDILKEEPEILENLRRNVRFMQKGFNQIGIATLPSETPIISIFVGEEGKALKLVVDLFERGIFATPVAYPAVPYGQALIRTSYMATHTQEELSKVLDVFEKLAPQYGILNTQVEVPLELTHTSESYNFDALYAASNS